MTEKRINRLARLVIEIEQVSKCLDHTFNSEYMVNGLLDRAATILREGVIKEQEIQIESLIKKLEEKEEK